MSGKRTTEPCPVANCCEMVVVSEFEQHFRERHPDVPTIRGITQAVERSNIRPKKVPLGGHDCIALFLIAPADSFGKSPLQKIQFLPMMLMCHKNNFMNRPEVDFHFYWMVGPEDVRNRFMLTIWNDNRPIASHGIAESLWPLDDSQIPFSIYHQSKGLVVVESHSDDEECMYAHLYVEEPR